MISVQGASRVGRMVRVPGQAGSGFARGGKRLSGGNGVSNGAKCRAFFNFNKNKDQEEDFRSGLSRSSFDVQEVEDYFNYMGMLAAEGTYDRLEKMLESDLEPVDLLLLMACSENDAPKVEELLRAGADMNVEDLEGKSPMELCTKDEIKEMLKRQVAGSA